MSNANPPKSDSPGLYQKSPSKANRCLAELESLNREKRIYRNAGACLDDLWKRFA